MAMANTRVVQIQNGPENTNTKALKFKTTSTTVQTSNNNFSLDTPKMAWQALIKTRMLSSNHKDQDFYEGKCE